MKNFTVFHDGKVIHEGNFWITSSEFPTGSYIRFQSSGEKWYFTIPKGNIMVINACDAPKWVRTWCLLLT